MGDTAYLKAFIDWNDDDDFEDANETVANLIMSWYLAVPTNAVTNNLLGFRIRYSNSNDMTPYRQVNPDEVEDYLIGVECAQLICLPLEATVKRE